MNTWAVLAGSNDKSIVEDNFAVLETELQGALKALRGVAIKITTIHHHMVGESPRIVFSCTTGVEVQPVIWLRPLKPR